MGNTLEFRNITKYFPGVKALDNVSFTAYSGEVLAFLGENGAGKSTLLKTLNGDYQPSSGQYLINGEEVHFRNPHEAIEAGVSIIYQERQILMELSVAENIYLGRMPANALGVINQHKANEMAARIIANFGLPIRPTDKVKDLSVAYQQMVEIMKAYSRENLRVICFDEPSASLSDSEIESLFRIIRKLRKTIHKKLQRQMYDHLCRKQEHGGSLTLRERQFLEEYSKIARKQGKDAVIRRENKTKRRKKKNRP